MPGDAKLDQPSSCRERRCRGGSAAPICA